jgi:hypothetical protein
MEYLRPSLIMRFLLSVYNSISLLVFNLPLTELLKDAKNGDEEAFFVTVHPHPCPPPSRGRESDRWSGDTKCVSPLLLKISPPLAGWD